MSEASSSAWPSASDRSRGRRRFLTSAVGALLILGPRPAGAQEGVFLSPAEAPRILFPGATAVTEQTVVSTPELRQHIRALLGRPPTLWEPVYQIFVLRRGEAAAGFVVVVEEIGKHRPITFAVGVTPAGRIHDLVVLAYREPYGGEVRERRFLRQYAGKGVDDPLQPYRDVRNIAGATLSVEATGRASKKAIAVLKAVGLVT